MSPKWLSPALASLVLALLPNHGRAQVGDRTPLAERAQRFVSFDYAKINNVIAGVAGGDGVVFVGEPLNGNVVVLSRITGHQIGQLPPPSNGFVLPFIVHSLGNNRVAVLDAGGLPQPQPFVPASPNITDSDSELSSAPRHSALVRITHWLTTLSFLLRIQKSKC
jgi:hypothetical protein